MPNDIDPHADLDLSSRFLVDPYLNWANGEGIPVHLEFGHNLLALETGRWERYDARGCFAHTHGRGDGRTQEPLAVDRDSGDRIQPEAQ